MRRLSPRWLLAAGLAAGALARLHHGAFELGLYWPDEIHQSLEPAHRAAFGYGLVAWEFRDGARSWAFPGLLAGVYRALAAAGVDGPEGQLLGFRLLFIALSVATGWACYRLARTLGATELAAGAAATAYGLCALTLYFSHRALGESASALPVALGFALALDRGQGPREPRKVLAGAALLALAVLLRLHNGLFCVGLLLLLGAERRWRALLHASVVFAAGAAVYAGLDWATWGRPLHSALVYLRFNLLEGKASLWGESPPGYYLRLLSSFALAPGLLLLAVLGLGHRDLRARGVFAIAAAFVLVHSLVPHKELRFMLPALPLLYACAALGMEVVGRAVPRALAAAALVAMSGVSAVRAGALTFGDVGQYEAVRPRDPAWGDLAGVNRLLIFAHHAPGLCGLKVEAVHLAWTGGYSHLRRRVPLYAHTGPDRASGRFSHVLTAAANAQGLEVVRREGDLVLAQLPVEVCAPDPRYDWALP